MPGIALTSPFSSSLFIFRFLPSGFRSACSIYIEPELVSKLKQPTGNWTINFQQNNNIQTSQSPITYSMNYSLYLDNSFPLSQSAVQFNPEFSGRVQSNQSSTFKHKSAKKRGEIFTNSVPLCCCCLYCFSVGFISFFSGAQDSPRELLVNLHDNAIRLCFLY